MSMRLSQRLFGVGKLQPSDTVAEMLGELRSRGSEGEARVIVAQRDDTVADALALFRRCDLHHLPVVSGATVIGIVSATDLLEYYAADRNGTAKDDPLECIMTENPHVIRKDAQIHEVVEVLAHARFRCLPVVNATGEIWDIVTTRDLVRFLELSLN